MDLTLFTAKVTMRGLSPSDKAIPNMGVTLCDRYVFVERRNPFFVILKTIFNVSNSLKRLSMDPSIGWGKHFISYSDKK